MACRNLKLPVDAIVTGQLETEWNQATLAQFVDRGSCVPPADDVNATVEVDDAMRGQRYH